MICDLTTIPNPNSRDTIRGHLKHGWYPGGFITAVLSDSLTDAAANADCINKHLLFEWAEWIYNNIPNCCWGSREIVDAWKGDDTISFKEIP